MFEILMFWVWVTVIVGVILSTLYVALMTSLYFWAKFLLGRAGYEPYEAHETMQKVKAFFGTPLKLFNYTPDDHLGGTRAIIYVCGLTYWFITTIFLVTKEIQGHWASQHIELISDVSGILAGLTAWVGPILVVVAGGSYLFVKGLKLWHKIGPKLKNL